MTIVEQHETIVEQHVYCRTTCHIFEQHVTIDEKDVTIVE